MEVKVGCCGWGFFRPKEFFGEDWKGEYASALQAYAEKFDLVEVNSTFYRIPQVKTAERWLRETREKNEDFEFTVKAFRGITHETKFAGKEAVKQFSEMKRMCKALDSRILLFQTAASFGPEKESIGNMRAFFSKIKRGRLKLIWEPRGEWQGRPERIREMCGEFDLVECVDPLRNESAVRNQEIAYFRLHGFGKPMMYNYRFSDAELRRVRKKVKECGAETAYVLFNNYWMYEDAGRFAGLMP